MHYVYILQSLSNNEIYVGSTNDLKKRFEDHNLGKVQSTNRYKPWKLIYYESYIVEKLARLRESKLKHHGNSMKELKKRIGLQKHKSDAGFTLIEILITVGILTILSGVGLFLSMDFYRGYSFNYERNLLVSILQKARSESMANINQSAHGFYYDGSNYIIFEGNSYSAGNPKNKIFPSAKSVSVICSPSCEIVFQQLSGDATAADITISGNSKTTIISLNEEGRINW